MYIVHIVFLLYSLIKRYFYKYFYYHIFNHQDDGEEIMEDACDDGGWDVGDEDLELPEELAPVPGDD